MITKRYQYPNQFDSYSNYIYNIDNKAEKVSAEETLEKINAVMLSDYMLVGKCRSRDCEKIMELLDNYYNENNYAS